MSSASIRQVITLMNQNSNISKQQNK